MFHCAAIVQRVVLFVLAFLPLIGAAEARRMALVIGQGAYAGGASATIGLAALANPKNDAKRMAAILQKHGFELIGCGGSMTAIASACRLGCRSTRRATRCARHLSARRWRSSPSGRARRPRFGKFAVAPLPPWNENQVRCA